MKLAESWVDIIGQKKALTRGVFRNLSRGAYIFFFPGGGGAQHPFGHENPLKSIDFTSPGWCLAPIAPPP